MSTYRHQLTNRGERDEQRRSQSTTPDYCNRIGGDMSKVHQNSIDTYYKYQTPNAKLEDKIIAYSLKTRHFTTTMVAERLGEKQSTLVSKINKLLASGDLVKEFDKHPCAITGHNAMWFYNPSYSSQLSLV